MLRLTPISLCSPFVTLSPLDQAHCDDLSEAVQDGALWQLWYTTIPKPELMRQEIDRRLALKAAGSQLPFAVIANASGRAVGMTSYLNIDAPNRRLEIGATWYRRSLQRTQLNTECKMLLLAHAFEDLDCIAVEFRTHYFNHASRRAIERLGAKLDGILRNHQITPSGTLRDTCVFSIIAAEWPTVKAHLAFELAKPRS